MSMRILKPEFEHNDKRGVFREIIRGDEWKELNYAMRRKGVNSGNHYHKSAKELFYVIRGDVTVHLENVKTGDKQTHHFTGNDVFIVEPYELHNFEYHEDTEFAILLSVPYDAKNPDLYERDEPGVEKGESGRSLSRKGKREQGAG